MFDNDTDLRTYMDSKVGSVYKSDKIGSHIYFGYILIEVTVCSFLVAAISYVFIMFLKLN